MKIQRSKNAINSIIFGVIYRLVITLCPFIIRTVMLYVMGVEYLGLSSLFTSLLSFLSLAELGVGSAMVYAMYKPIADEDDDAICALLNLYKKLYRIIGTVILVVGLILLPFIDNLIKGSYPDAINLYILYAIYLANTVVSYYLFGYKQSILMAYQRQDIISKISMIVQLLMYVFQIAVIFISRNYYAYIILLPIFTVITNFVNSYIVDKNYPQYKCRGRVPKEKTDEIKKNVYALIGTKLSSTVLHSSDNLVLSAFVGLTMVAMYGNYYYILNAVAGFVTIVYTSLTAGIGNSIVTEDPEKNYDDFNRLTFMNNWLISWCTVCLLCLMQPFMKIWTGEELMFSTTVVILFAAYFYIYLINKVVLTYKDAAGMWRQDFWRPYVVMAVNLALNISTVQILGVYGVIFSTIVSLFIAVPWSTHVLYKYLFKRSARPYAKNFIVNAFVAAAACAITYFVCSLVNINDILNLLIRAVICCVVPNLFMLLVFWRTQNFKKSVVKVKEMLSRFKR